MPSLTPLTIDPTVSHIHLQRMNDAAKIKDFAAQAAGITAKQDVAMTKASKDFEAVFLSQVIRPMFDTVEIDSTFGGGKGEEVFRDMLVDGYGKLMVATGGIGLASPVKEALIQAQTGATTGSKSN